MLLQLFPQKATNNTCTSAEVKNHGKAKKDGKYIVALDTDDFHKLDTIPLTQAHVDTIRQMLIEGEVYKMPAFYDSPLLILDAPSGSVSVKFTDASYSCNNIPPFKWGGECIEKVYQYLKTLQPEHKKTE